MEHDGDCCDCGNDGSSWEESLIESEELNDRRAMNCRGVLC
jgi:hypothetical protein